jgi:CRP-like cAMP-binding protein
MISKIIEVGGGTQLVKTGDVPNKMYMLLSGIMRVYLSTEEGK